jgi:hypothetical protein
MSERLDAVELACFDDGINGGSAFAARRKRDRRNLHPRKSWRRSQSSLVTGAAKLSIEKLPAPSVKLPGINLAPIDRFRHRLARRKGFANDSKLLLNRPSAPNQNTRGNLNAGPATAHTTGRSTTRVVRNLDRHLKLLRRLADSEIMASCARRLPDHASEANAFRDVMTL